MGKAWMLGEKSKPLTLGLSKDSAWDLE